MDSYSEINIKKKFNPSNNDGGDIITKYNIYKGTDNILSNFTKIYLLTYSIDSSILEYDDTTVSSCLNYYYTITSENSYGESELSLDYYINAKTQSTPQYYELKLVIIPLLLNVMKIQKVIMEDVLMI